MKESCRTQWRPRRARLKVRSATLTLISCFSVQHRDWLHFSQASFVLVPTQMTFNGTFSTCSIIKSVQMRLSDSICFFTEESVLSVSVGGEELPSMTPESQIQVSNTVRWHHITYLCVWGLRKSTVMFLTAFSIGPARLCTLPCTRLT